MVSLFFKEARLGTTTSSDIETNKICGQIYTFMKAISKKDGDLLSQFDNNKENRFQLLRDWLIYQYKLEIQLIRKG